MKGLKLKSPETLEARIAPDIFTTQMMDSVMQEALPIAIQDSTAGIVGSNFNPANYNQITDIGAGAPSFGAQ